MLTAAVDGVRGSNRPLLTRTLLRSQRHSAISEVGFKTVRLGQDSSFSTYTRILPLGSLKCTVGSSVGNSIVVSSLHSRRQHSHSVSPSLRLPPGRFQGSFLLRLASLTVRSSFLALNKAIREVVSSAVLDINNGRLAYLCRHSKNLEKDLLLPQNCYYESAFQLDLRRLDHLPTFQPFRPFPAIFHV